MALPKFEYMTPKTLDEACSLLALHKGWARVISGGTDIMPQMKERAVVPQYLVGLKSISELNYVKHDKKSGLKIGCLATLAEVAASRVVERHFPLLKEAISLMASVQVRNAGTVVGNLCNAAPLCRYSPFFDRDGRESQTRERREKGEDHPY